MFAHRRERKGRCRRKGSQKRNSIWFLLISTSVSHKAKGISTFIDDNVENKGHIVGDSVGEIMLIEADHAGIDSKIKQMRVHLKAQLPGTAKV